MNTKSPLSNSYWIIIIAASLLISLTMGLRQTFGLYMPSFTEINSGGREFFGFAIAVQNLFWGLCSPLFGGIADRYGCGRVAIWGSIIYSLGLLIMFLATPFGLFSGQILVGIGLAGAGFSVSLGAIGKSVPLHKRSMALGIGSAGGSFGQFALVPISQGLAAQFGWSLTFAILAGIAAATMLPAAFAIKQRDIITAPSSTKNKPSLKKVLVTALTNYNYILLTGGFLVCGLQVVFIATHLPGYLADYNITSHIAAWCLSLIGLFNIAGTLFCGWVGGRYSKKNSLTILYILRSIVMIVFILSPPTVFSALVFSSALGFLWLGTVPLTSGLVAHFFGTAYMSMLYGFVFFSHQIGSFLGAWLGGFFYDLTGSYDYMWWLAIIMGFVAAALHFPIKESRYSNSMIGHN